MTDKTDFIIFHIDWTYDKNTKKQSFFRIYTLLIIMLHHTITQSMNKNYNIMEING